MSEQLEIETPATAEGTRQPAWLAWFRRKHPHFFTAKVEAHRNAGLAPTFPLPEPKQYWQPVTRKLGCGKTTHMMLHVEQDEQLFYFKCPRKETNVKMPVHRDMLMDAIAMVHGSEWVRLQIGTDVLRLNRAELRAAVHKLQAL